MPPRRNVQRPVQEVVIEDLQREIAQLQQRLARFEQREPVANTNEDEEVNPFHQESSSDDDNARRPMVRKNKKAHHDWGIKIELPEFDGRMDTDEFINWLQTVERVLEFKEIPADRIVKLVAIKLKRMASLWWENLKRSRNREGKSKIVTWAKMKRELQRKYIPDQYKQEVFLKYTQLQQQQLSVEEYISEFEQLSLKCDIVEPEEHTIARFLSGLQPSIANVVQLQPYWTFQDVTGLALKVEKQQSKSRRFYQKNNSSKPVIDKEIKNIKSVAGTSKPQDEATARPPNRWTQGSGTTPARKCFKCQGFGHIASNCPNRRVVTMIEEPENEDVSPTVDNNVPAVEPTYIMGDEGNLLVLQQSLNIHKEDSWLRHSIFRTRCTVKDCVCNVIIDSGSCENVVAAIMVEKLQLNTTAHPKSYALSWIRKNAEIQVSKQCLVDFSIGPFKDQVQCDVVPMDACHLLLGRPWQFDKGTIHNGTTNTYSFVHDQQSIVLLPTPVIEQEGRSATNIFSHALLLQELKAAQQGLLVMLMEENPPQEDIHEAVRPLLQQFQDVLVSELPAGLPPLRDIQHHMELIPVSVLPNRPAYRLRPDEHQELQ
ncbi:hypothetical protein KFK09_010155 [Dendrobium nobile]|uniref:CCHC-type domain-containing protein n=1 Tax=Dendrobium nobile TaxID=94219 RepID=A0A8T3BLH0_DENNO|nr:hypothetical protein KFK09_010155 [Dendrobium nobile]